MSTSLTVSPISVSVGWNFQNVLTWANAVNSSNFSWSKTLANGTGAGNAQYVYVTQPSIAASSSLNIDLAGSVTDVYGNTITFAKIKVIYVELTTTTAASTIDVGGASSAGFANWISSAGTFATDQPKVRVRNGGIFFLGCTDGTGYAVTATTADILKITNNDGAVAASLNILIVGE